MPLIKKILRKIKRIMIRILGSKTDEFYWRFRHIFEKSWARTYISHKSIEDPHRKFLLERIASHSPFGNILEIGCAAGPNLYLIAKKFPETKLYGIDISKKAIKIGQDFFKKENIQNVLLNSGKADDLKKFKDKSIDLVFTDAVLIYFGPDRINSVIQEMIRITRKGLILVELHHDLPVSVYKDNWIHNYRLLFNNFVPGEKIKIIKMPSGMRAGDWEKWGHITEIIL